MNLQLSLFQQALVAGGTLVFTALASAAPYTKYNCEIKFREYVVVEVVKFQANPPLPNSILDSCPSSIPADRITERIEYNTHLRARPNTRIACMNLTGSTSGIRHAIYVAPGVEHPAVQKTFSLECGPSDIVGGSCFPRGNFDPFMTFPSVDTQRGTPYVSVFMGARRDPLDSPQFLFSLNAQPFARTGMLPGASTKINIGQPIEVSITSDQGNEYHRGLSTFTAKCTPETVNP